MRTSRIVPEIFLLLLHFLCECALFWNKKQNNWLVKHLSMEVRSLCIHNHTCWMDAWWIFYVHWYTSQFWKAFPWCCTLANVNYCTQSSTSRNAFIDSFKFCSWVVLQLSKTLFSFVGHSICGAILGKKVKTVASPPTTGWRFTGISQQNVSPNKKQKVRKVQFFSFWFLIKRRNGLHSAAVSELFVGYTSWRFYDWMTFSFVFDTNEFSPVCFVWRLRLEYFPLDHVVYLCFR